MNTLTRFALCMFTAGFVLLATSCDTLKEGTKGFTDAVEKGYKISYIHRTTGEELPRTTSIEVVRKKYKKAVAKQQSVAKGKIEHNRAVARKHSSSDSDGDEKKHSSSDSPAMAKLSVDDIKSLTEAQVKPDVISAEIRKSKASYSSQEVSAARSANVDPSIIAQMEK